MSRIIPNSYSWIGFATTVASLAAPTTAELTSAINLTGYLASINASSQGNVIPTPSLDSLFETTIVGTSQASFTGDFYRDDTSDLAWTTLPRKTKGVFVISRFGGKGTNSKPITGDFVECWPVLVVSRTASQMQSNTVQMFTLTCAVIAEPNEAATVGA